METLIVRRKPGSYLVVHVDQNGWDCVVVACNESNSLGIDGYTYGGIESAMREPYARSYKTVKAALEDYPEACRCMNFDAPMRATTG